MLKRVMVVEDERPLRVAAESNLEKNQFEVVTASTAEEAKEILESGIQIDAIWLDHYLLGDETGLDLLCKLRKNKSWQSIPVFAVTNSVGDDKVQSYQVLGIEKYFVKSNSTMNEIIGSIKEVLS